MMFGGDGLHLVALTGPGRIWLQSMPIAMLANAIARTWAVDSRRPTRWLAARWGGVLGDFLRG